MESYNFAKEAARRRKREGKRQQTTRRGKKSVESRGGQNERSSNFRCLNPRLVKPVPSPPEIQAGGDFLESGRAIFLGMKFWFLECSAQNHSTVPTGQNQSNKKGLDPSQSKQAEVDESPWGPCTYDVHAEGGGGLEIP